jgi:hypothetical protein
MSERFVHAEHDTAATRRAGAERRPSGPERAVDAVLRLQRTAGNAAVVAQLAGEEEERSPVHDVVASGGRPLDAPLRAEMEARLGADFSDVRVHNDSQADASARAVSASAYTVGSHVAFRSGAYDPSSQQGKVTLAHELTHVVQQRRGPVSGTPTAGGISVSDPGDRFEREAAREAEAAMAAPLQRSAAPAEEDHGEE